MPKDIPHIQAQRVSQQAAKKAHLDVKKKVLVRKLGRRDQGMPSHNFSSKYILKLLCS